MPFKKFLAKKAHKFLRDQAIPRMIPQENYEEFVYTPLASPRDEIRLLEVLPARVQGEIAVRCNIRHVRLDSNPQYAAVSYTWGPSIEPTSVIINGKELRVPHSAYAALRGLRLPDTGQHGSNSRVVWIDAICIDQNNVPEKEKQILAMKEVYQVARHVFVWLHVNPGDDPAGAIQFLRYDPVAKITGGLNTNTIRGFEALLRHTWFSRTWTFQEVVLPRSLSIVYGSSGGDPKNTEIPWGTLVDKARGLIDPSQSSSGSVGKFYTPGPEIVKVLSSIIEIEKSRARLDSADNSMEGALFSTRGRSVTNDRDAVYALLGIASDAKKLDIIPNYALSTQNVYQDCATRILQTTNSLRLLSVAGLEHRNLQKHPDLPSWVPDWTSISNLNPLGSRGENTEIQTLQSSVQTPRWISSPHFPHPSVLLLKGYILDAPKIFSTPFPTSPSPSHSSDASHITTQAGVTVASTPTINISSQEFEYAQLMLLALEESERLVADELDQSKCYVNFPPWPRDRLPNGDRDLAAEVQRMMAFKSGQNLFFSESSTFHEHNCAKLPFEEFCKVLTAFLPGNQGEEKELPQFNPLNLKTFPLTTRYTEYKLTLSDLLSRHPNPQTHISVSRILACEADVGDMFSMGRPSKPYGLPIHAPLVYATQRRRFCMTMFGKMALVPAAAQQGDLIVLLEGAGTPMLVRRSEGGVERWGGVLGEGKVPLELVGECWVEGAVTGTQIEALVRERGVAEVVMV